ncbi:lipopolysaccharide biosynthesis protein [Mycobacterium sp. SMC-4]|uniref:lipopolysaccharide biosynthesis protein n=1 Tax=Mycobacterium sp. SMC-4 TaxID=2857059 RepID=UPI003D00CE98
MTLAGRIRPGPRGTATAQRNMGINTASLVAANVLTGVLGLVFWGAAARLYPAEAVGIGAAVLNSAVMLSTLSMLSIDTLCERFLPMAGVRTAALVRQGFTAVAITSLVAGTVVVLVGPDELFVSGAMMLIYPLLVAEHALFALEDKTTAGLGVARWAAAKNVFHALFKLIVLGLLAWTGSSLAIVASWGLVGAFAFLVVLLAMRRRWRSDPQFLRPSTLPSPRVIFRYSYASFALTAVWTAAPLVVPLLVLSQFGAVTSAYFALAWSIVSAAYLTVHLVISPYVAEAVAHPTKIYSLSVRMMQGMAVVALTGSLGLVVLGPLALGLVGGAYRAEGASLLYVAALFIPLSAVAAIFEGFARVTGRLGLIFAVRASAAALIVGGCHAATTTFGLIGVGWLYLAVEFVVATLLIVPLVRSLREFRRVEREQPYATVG